MPGTKQVNTWSQLTYTDENYLASLAHLRSIRPEPTISTIFAIKGTIPSEAAKEIADICTHYECNFDLTLQGRWGPKTSVRNVRLGARQLDLFDERPVEPVLGAQSIDDDLEELGDDDELECVHSQAGTATFNEEGYCLDCLQAEEEKQASKAPGYVDCLHLRISLNGKCAHCNEQVRPNTLAAGEPSDEEAADALQEAAKIAVQEQPANGRRRGRPRKVEPDPAVSPATA